MDTLPGDIHAALVDCAKQYLLTHYVNNKRKLNSFNDLYASLIRICSFNLSGYRRKNLRRLEKLVEAGLLVERPRYQDGKAGVRPTGARSFYPASRELIDTIGAEAIRYWESVGYVVGQMMDPIETAEEV